MGVSLKERSGNIRMEEGVVSSVEIAREARLRWYGPVIRMEEVDSVKMAWKSHVEGRTRGRRRIAWRDGIQRLETIGPGGRGCRKYKLVASTYKSLLPH